MAAIFGTYIATMSLHVALVKLAMPNETSMMLSVSYTGFVVWIGLMVLFYFFKRARHAWVLLLIISTCFMIISGVMI